MSQFFRFLQWRRLSALTLILLLAPGLVSPLALQASPPETSERSAVTLPPTHPDVQALNGLIQRYNISLGEYTTNLGATCQKRLVNRPLSRYEFAVVLQAVANQMDALTVYGTTVSQTDRDTVQRLQKLYRPELANDGRVDALEARDHSLQRQQFSTTTKLNGSVVNVAPLNLPATRPVSPAPASGNRPAFQPPRQGIPGRRDGAGSRPAIAPVAPAPMPTVTGGDQLSTRLSSGGLPRDQRIHRPGTFNTEDYNVITDNPFQRPGSNPLSTFSIDVDTASYSNVRRFLQQGQLPPKDAVRLEEMINYFSYDYPQPEGDRPFSINTDVAAAPWNPQHKLVQIGLQGKQLQTLQPSNLVFLVDVSGSMQPPNKLPLVKQSLCLLVNQLSPQDKVTMVVYAGNAGLVLPPTPGNQKEKILAAIDNLEAGGSTAGGAGIELAYKIAQENLLKGGNNRVILATDGDFNVGVSSDGELVRLIEQKRDRGIFLTVLGFGMGNYKDGKMEQLANKGNGNYAYIDNLMEAKKVLVKDLRGTLFTIAKDVKIQVEFNPAKVQAYRLIGYENRLLRDQDFNDDTKDAGEIGAGHTVTALYEIIPVGVTSSVKLPTVDPLKYQQQNQSSPTTASDELMQVKLRYKQPTGSTSQLLIEVIRDRDVTAISASNNLQFAAAVAMYGMLLRDSEFKGQTTIDTVLRLANQAKGRDAEGYRAEFINLVERYRVVLAQQKATESARQ